MSRSGGGGWGRACGSPHPRAPAGCWAWGPQSLERLLRGCRGAARGPGRGWGFLCRARPKGPVHLAIQEERTDFQAELQKGQVHAPWALGLALLQEERAPRGLFRGAWSGAPRPASPCDFCPTSLLAVIPVSLVCPREAVASGGILRGHLAAQPACSSHGWPGMSRGPGSRESQGAGPGGQILSR